MGNCLTLQHAAGNSDAGPQARHSQQHQATAKSLNGKTQGLIQSVAASHRSMRATSSDAYEQLTLQHTAGNGDPGPQACH